MKTVNRTRTALAFVVILIGADVTSGVLTDLGAEPLDGSSSDAAELHYEDVRPLYDEAERRFEGGGPLVLFHDSMDAQTAAHYATMPASTGTYYGGAIPDPERDHSARWASDPYSWGKGSYAGSTQEAWFHSDGFWRFGQTVDGEPAYAAGVSAELVAPVIDLRSIQPLHDENVDIVKGIKEPVPEFPIRNFGWTADCSNPTGAGEAEYCFARQNANDAYAEQGPGGTRSGHQPVAPAAAAMRLLHAYDFDAGFELSDGSRVEISRFDDGRGQWTPWEGVQPTGQILRVGEEEIHARVFEDDMMTEGRVEPGEESGEAPSLNLYGADRLEVDRSDENPGGAVTLVGGENAAPRPRPYMYQGTVASSARTGTAWDGFAKTSGSFVESIFDLTPFAGELVRVRFVVSTASAFDAEQTRGHGGWIIEEVEVHGAGPAGIDVLGLASPGDGSVVAPGDAIAPTLAIHNRGREAQEVEIRTIINGQEHRTSTTISVGSYARSIVAATDQALELPVGPHRIRVEAVTIHQDPVEDALKDATATGSFHIVVGSGAKWQTRNPEVRPLSVTEDGEVEGFGRFVEKGQTVRLRIEVENLDSIPHRVEIAGIDGAARIEDVSGAWDLAAAVIDRDGKIYGTTKAEVEVLELNVSRSVSGTHGRPAGVVQSAAWTWSGTSVSRPLDAVLLDGQGEVVADLGSLLVESAGPAPLEIDYRNPWEPGASCRQVESWEDRRGVVQCTGPSTLTSPAVTIIGLDLERSNTTSVALRHRGGAIEASLEGITAAAPQGVPSPEIPWITLSSTTFDASPTWVNERHAFMPVPEGFSGWLRIRIEGTAGFDIDSASLDLEVTDPEPAAIPLQQSTFDVWLEEQQPIIESTSASGMVILDGKTRAARDLVDGAAGSAYDDESVAPDCVGSTAPGLFGLGGGFVGFCRSEHASLVHDGQYDVGLATYDNGDVHSTVGVGNSILPVDRTVWGGRMLEDAVLLLPDPIDLTGTGRPVVTFKHWYDTGRHGTGYVEAAMDPGDAWEHDALNVTPSAEHTRPRSDDGDWRILGTFQGTLDAPRMQAMQVSLADYADERVHLRFRFHTSPSIQADSQGEPGPGWAIEDIAVRGWTKDGPTVVVPADETAQTRVVRGGLVASAGYAYGPVASCWSTDGALVPDSCAKPVATQAIDIATMLNPVLRLEHSGGLGPTSQCPKLDFEYQTRRAGEPWPLDWHRATPYDGSRPLNPGEGDPPPLLDPATGDVQGIPFTGCDELSQPIQYKNTDLFDLGPLQGRGDEIRLRIIGGASGGGPSGTPIQAIAVEEWRHIVDAGAQDISSFENDLPHLQAKAPGIVAQRGIQSDIVIANDAATVAVNVTNAGGTGIDVDVALEAVPVDAPGAQEPALGWIRVEGNRRITTGLPVGHVHLEPEATSEVLFRVVFGKNQPPGLYRLSARATVTDGVDTNLRNDVATALVEVLPIRHVFLDPVASGVTPLITGPDRTRTVAALVTNHGNLDEEDLSIGAELVQMTGLDTFEPLDPAVVLPAQHQSVPRRGNSAWVNWTVDELTLPSGVDPETLFQPGKKYAAVVHLTVGPDSATKWWEPNAGEPFDDLVNLTEAPVESCGCMLLPFLVEKVLYETDLTAANSTSALDESFPLDTDSKVLEGWTTRTFVEGEPLVDPARPDLPRWHVTEGSVVEDLASGTPTGKVWHLPGYSGRENLRHELVSPTLPTHVVDSLSRAVLSMRYASDVDGSKVTIENRRLVGGQWTDWAPLDELRRERVAVVVSPDFPNIIAAGQSDIASSYGAEPFGEDTGIPGHPLPPFYDNPGNRDYIDAGENTCGLGPQRQGKCFWSPPPIFESERNQIWVDALDEILYRLENAHGSGSVGLYTTIGPDLGIGEPRPGGALVHTVVDAEARQIPFVIKDLEQLALRLDSYGAIVILGDNTTTTYADEISVLRSVTHAPGEWADRTPSAIGHKYHEDLFAILRTAVDAGIPVLSSFGPGAGTLARSGVVHDGATLTTWQTTPILQLTLGAVRCSPETERSEDQPRPACSTPAPTNADEYVAAYIKAAKPDEGEYIYYSPYDAQSTALQQLIMAYTTARSQVHGGLPAIVGAGDPCAPRFPRQHVEDPPLFMPEAPCVDIVPTWVTAPTKGKPAIVSGAFPEDVPEFVEALLTELRRGDGFLPATDGRWADLPVDYQFPVGGRFFRDDVGTDRFDGMPMQVRVVVESDDALGGHGGIAIDRLTVMGTPRERGLGVRFVEPIEGQTFVPGDPFVPRLEVANRGTNFAADQKALLTMTHWDRGQGFNQCFLPDITPFEVDIRGLQPGEVREIVLDGFNQGFFPNGNSCPPPSQQENAFNLTFALEYAEENLQTWRDKGRTTGLTWDHDPLDDVAKVTAFGGAVPNGVEVAAIEVTPTEAALGETDEIEVVVRLRNAGTADQHAQIRLGLDYARVLPCQLQPFQPYEKCPETGTGYPDDLTIPNSLQTVPLARGTSTAVRFSIDPSQVGEDGLREGVYMLRITANAFLPAGSPVPLGTSVRWIHLTAAEDVATARSLHPPDGAFAMEFSNLSHLESLATQPQRSVWHPSGFLVAGPAWPSASEAHREHDGRYGPDPATRDGNQQALLHGWRIMNPCNDTECPHPSLATIAEWRRSGDPSYREGVDPAEWDQPGLAATQQPGDEATNGYQDFGPDALIWYPHDASDQNPSSVEQTRPYLSLAAYERPILSFMSRFSATQNTGFVVQMQLADRECASERDCRPFGWTWNGPWMTLIPDSQKVSSSDLEPSAVVASKRKVGNCGIGVCDDILTWERNTPSNPIGAHKGFWGVASGRHSEDGGWQRVEIPVLGACESATSCRAAADLARPVRFRFIAASYGGDLGESWWQIGDVSLSSHDIEFVGPSTVSVGMPDASTQDVVLRLQNDGAVDDAIRVTAAPPPGRAAIFPGRGNVTFATHPSFSDAGEEIVVHLEPGESRVVWARIRTDIYDHLRQGAVTPVPFIVEATSIIDPHAEAEVLVDASFESRAWPDLDVQALVLDEDRDKPVFTTDEGVPVKPFAVIQNAGELAIGGPSEPIHVRLLRVPLDATTEEPIEDEMETIATAQIEEEILPFRSSGQEIIVAFDEWIPDQVGKYHLTVEVNPLDGSPGLIPLPERNIRNNEWTRIVSVGPIDFADLHITDTWLVPFDNGCDGPRAERAVSGHAYCIAAHVENRGKQAAVLPDLAFGVVGSAPFSSGVPPLREAFGNSTFPGRAEGEEPPAVVIKSSPRVLTLRSDGTNAWNFYVDVTSQSIFPNFDNKTRQLRALVDEYRLAVADVPKSVAIAPGEEVRFTFNITNKGTAPATPTGLASGNNSMLRMHLVQPPTILPGETVPVRLAMSAAQSARNESDALPSMAISTLEDDFVNVPLAVAVHVRSATASRATLVPLQAPPGAADVDAVLDASRAPDAQRWTVLAAEAPLLLPVRPESHATPAFTATPAVLQMIVANHTHPGPYRSEVRMAVTSGNVERILNTNVDVFVEADARLEVDPGPGRLDTLRSAPAQVGVEAFNAGNVPLRVTAAHRVDLGQILHGNETIVVVPGERHTFTATVLGGSGSRALGETSMTWHPTHAPHETDAQVTPWVIEYHDAKVDIVTTDLDQLRPSPGSTALVRVTVRNPTSVPVEAVVEAYVDGTLHGRTRVDLAASEEDVVTVPFKTGRAGEGHRVILVAHPVGTTADVTTTEFHRVGASVSGRVVAEEPTSAIQDSRLLAGGAGILIAAALTASIYSIRRRIR